MVTTLAALALLLIATGQCAPLPRDQLEAMYNVVKPGKIWYDLFMSNIADDIEIIQNGQSVAKGRDQTRQYLDNWGLKSWNSHFLEILYHGNSVTVHRRTTAVSLLGCSTVFHALDIIRFDDAGRYLHFEFNTHEEVAQLVSELTCKRYFNREDLIQMHTNLYYWPNGNPRVFDLKSRAAFEESWAPNGEFETFDGKKVVGIDALLQLFQAGQFKSINRVVAHNYYVQGNSLIVPQGVSATTYSGCVVLYTHIGKYEFDDAGKIRKYKTVATDVVKGVVACGLATPQAEAKDL
jgi:hypothetical protein